MLKAKSLKELDALFTSGKTPATTDFSGEYYVDMLTGAPSLRFLNHRKTFANEDGRIKGSNLLLRNLGWGNFVLSQADYQGRRAMLINYNVPENTAFSRHIRDYVVCMEQGKYLGRLNLLIGNKLRFIGYFSLTKKA